MRAHRFLLEVHSAEDAGALRRVIPSGVARVIACDRVSFNEMDMSPGRNNIVPVPVPLGWARFGEVYQAHLLDHPLLYTRGRVRPRRVVDLDDPRHGSRWRNSALRHEYFLPLGIRHQLTVVTSRHGSRCTGVGVNRDRGYDSRDRILLGVLSAHFAQAWRNVATLDALRGQRTEGEGGVGHNGVAIIAADPRRGTMRAISPRGLDLLRLYCGTDSGGQGTLPDAVRRWLQDQQLRLAAKDSVAEAVPYSVRGAAGSMTVRLAQHRSDECVILLEVEPAAGVARVPIGEALTPRETEILGWLREGKRNSEIGTILGISDRTVGKHVEHLLQKLGVETRTAAVRAFAERTMPDRG